MFHIIFSSELEHTCPALLERIFVRVLISPPVFPQFCVSVATTCQTVGKGVASPSAQRLAEATRE